MQHGGHINPNPRGTEAPPRNQRPQVQGFSGRSGGDRSWDHFKQIILEENGGRVPVAPPAGQKVPPRSKDTIKEDLVIASRILASPDSGILDALGHVSVRNPNNPNHYFISRASHARSAIRRPPPDPSGDDTPVGWRGERRPWRSEQCAKAGYGGDRRR